MTDLIAWVADNHQRDALRGLFTRHQSLGVRPFSSRVQVDPGKDPGCRTQGVNRLRLFLRQFRYALLMFDHEGSGAENTPAIDLESQLEAQLNAAGWGGRAATIVVEPEIEAWIWTPSPQVDIALGWSRRLPGVRDWLRDQGFQTGSQGKFQNPKDAVKAALREVRKAPSGAIFRQIAEKVSFQQCQDRAFKKLWTCLRSWFPV